MKTLPNESTRTVVSSGLEKKIEKIETDIKSNSFDIFSNSEQINTLNEKMDTVESVVDEKIEELEEKVGDKLEDISNLKETTRFFSPTNPVLPVTNNLNSTNKNPIASDVVSKEFTKINTVVNKHYEEQLNLKDKVDDNTENINKLDEDLTTLNDEVTEVTNVVNRHEQNIGELADNINNIVDGTTVVGKAEKDADGKKITETYATKRELEDYAPYDKLVLTNKRVMEVEDRVDVIEEDYAKKDNIINFVDILPSEDVKDSIYSTPHSYQTIEEKVTNALDIIGSYTTLESTGKYLVDSIYEIEVDSHIVGSFFITGNTVAIYEGDFEVMIGTFGTLDVKTWKVTTNVNHRDFFAYDKVDGVFVKLANVDQVEDFFIRKTEKGSAGGIAILDRNGKIPLEELSFAPFIYLGVSHNFAEDIASIETKQKGMVFISGEAQTYEDVSYNAGDWIIYNGTVWEKSTNSNVVASVNGKIGTVTLSASDVGALPNTTTHTTDDVKIDGSNATSNGVSTMLNKLTVDESSPNEKDYYISQSAGGGTTTVTYHRRPLKALWEFIKTKIEVFKYNGSVTSVSVKMNGSTMGTVTESGTIDLGDVLTSASMTNYLNKKDTGTSILKGKVQVGDKDLNIVNAFSHIRNIGNSTSVTGFKVNGATFSVNGDGSASFQHKSYNDDGTGVNNRAVLRFYGKEDKTGKLQFAVNSTTGSTPAESDYKDVLLSDSVQSYAKSGSNITVAKSVPKDAKFTDTTYSNATKSASGLMSSTDKSKLDGIESGATKNTGTVTSVSVKMNGSVKGTITDNGTIDLGTVLTAHQSLSGYIKEKYKKFDVSNTNGKGGYLQLDNGLLIQWFTFTTEQAYSSEYTFSGLGLRNFANANYTVIGAEQVIDGISRSSLSTKTSTKFKIWSEVRGWAIKNLLFIGQGAS